MELAMRPYDGYMISTMQDGNILFVIIDLRLFDNSLPVESQLAKATFHGVMTPAEAYNMGASFINMANSSTFAFARALRDVKMARAASEVSPVTDEEKAKLATFIHGMSDVNLDPDEGGV